MQIKKKTEKFKKNFANLSKQKKVITISSGVLVLLLMLSIPTVIIMKFDKKNQEEIQLKNTSKKASNFNQNYNKKKSLKNKNDSKEESFEETNLEKDSSEESDDLKNSQIQKEVGNNSSVTSNNNISSRENNFTQSSQEQTQTPVQNVEPVRQQTEWEILGITQEAYYNTPSNADDEVVILGGSQSQCNSKANEIAKTYVRHNVTARAYSINGKYTKNNIGCGIIVTIDGRAYQYNQAQAVLNTLSNSN